MTRITWEIWGAGGNGHGACSCNRCQNWHGAGGGYYNTKTISTNELEKLKGTRVLVVNALRIREHISHFNLEEALNFINEVNPEVAYLTHVSHLMGKTEDVEKQLPEYVKFAYDGLQIEI